jgi:Fe-S-cluster containining protein
MATTHMNLAQLLTQLTDEIERAYVAADAQLIEMLALSDRQIGRTSSCGPCTLAGCCYQKVMTNLVEVLPLVRHLRQSGRQQPALRQQLRQVGERMEAYSPDEWFDLAVPCQFLTAERRCSVYAWRPWACRAHHAWSAAELCSPPTGGATVTLVANLGQPQAQLFFDLQGGVQQTLGLGTEHVVLAALPRLLAIVLEAVAAARTATADDVVAFFRHLLSQPYPRPENLRAWAGGVNPFRRGRLDL